MQMNYRLDHAGHRQNLRSTTERRFPASARCNQLPGKPDRFGSGPRIPIRARSSIAASEAGQMAASDYVPTFFKKPLALGGASTDEYTPFYNGPDEVKSS